MRLTVFAATLAFLMWGTPAFAGMAPDEDVDGISDGLDNCSTVFNEDQDDSDTDNCGNMCDADYTNDGGTGFPDFTAFSLAFGGTDPVFCHSEPLQPCGVGFPSFTFFSSLFGGVPGPSGTTTGTTACP